MFCVKCGKELKPEWKVCPNCGEPVEQMKAHDTPNMVSDKANIEDTSEYEIRMEVHAGELTISGQRRFTSEIFIKGKEVMVRNYMNTKSYSAPVDTRFMTRDIQRIKYKRHAVIRKIHKTRYIIAGILFVLGIVTSVFYLCLIALIIALLNYIDSCSKAMEISLVDGRKVYIYYFDQDDVIQIEKELMRRKNKIS
ncbi:hypothetical protein B5F07_19845 [Lachnoclostridium sp. An169]|uniref:zinc ribbon domain-containing protein n=1 Tax=Lachnoclostridium sp. An169 TaxID=1965569 RepID=UPI000B39041C|nr:zinc ribbon domain-containing protein [Lachnoclostridium sp. An169]OUP80761.1 hypothetical protein B5F07_19845 [Lachnoclostridium sp. An169]